ncbi:phosphatase inhibitor [Babesia ovis]|uniref:Phosphatase inhibitor n=1 Tax=Babesia ovis TaxID=5869 RepID=A0A9W5TDI6_BABOV|nr:phosphatase inhibitor [Babesia ovis]
MSAVDRDPASPQGGKRAAKKTITWDDETIREHDKDRGTRAKILEADTPYCYLSDADSSDESVTQGSGVDYSDLAQQVVDRLCKIQQSTEKGEQFLERRKKHYSNEFFKRRCQNRLSDYSDDDYYSDEESDGTFVNYKNPGHATIN